MLPARRALLSVSDKSGLVDFARGLTALGVELVSTGGTARHLRAAGLDVVSVSTVTGFPEILDGRVKTLHPRIHAGLLADREKPEHLAALEEHGIERIDLVVVNLYPFRETVARGDASAEEIVEMIDIGGPSMVRAAAKNFGGVAVVVDPADYAGVLAALERGGGVLGGERRRELAAKAFAHTAAYDAAVAAWFARGEEGAAELFPAELEIRLERELVPRYGENPHQAAAVYRQSGGAGVLGGAQQIQGKELSWNNLLDADAARKLVALFADPAVAILKHNNPCGVGRGEALVEAYRRALECDPVSAFGSIVALNRALDAATAREIAELFVEVLLVPELDDAARDVLAARKNLRLLVGAPYAGGEPVELRAIDGGFLAQQADGCAEDPAGWSCPTAREPSAEEREALAFAWSVARYVKSNAIVVANARQTIGIGAGQMSRVDSCRLALTKARQPVAGAVAASDAFFPFRDGLDVLAEGGVRAVVQPGGSKRDDEVVAAADEHGIAMLFTGRRHFRH